jgi:hypothetical protein
MKGKKNFQNNPHEGGKFQLPVLICVKGIIPDPNMDPDPHVFGPTGSGSIRWRYGSGYGSGSGSFDHLSKNSKKTLIPFVL